jgi:competence protein ComEA
VSGDGEAGAAGPSGSEPPAGGSPGEIVVSVTGLVGQPGVVTLNSGSRVADAIAAAGGATADVDLTGMNLAARLADGDSVVVGAAPAAGDVASGVSGGVAGSVTAAASAPAGGPIDLNSADEAALDTLPGVGPVMAQNILAWRETNGRFTSIEQLQEISGIGPSRYAQISPLVTVAAG